MHEPNNSVNSLASWYNGDDVCALADYERHLGHILKVESQWIAYDGTRLGEDGIGFRLIGVFPDIASAKIAVELATVCIPASKTIAAGVM